MRKEVRPDAKRRLSTEASEQANQFDATVLHNYIYDHYAENNELREAVDVAMGAYDLAAGDHLNPDAFGAAETLNALAKELADERVEELIGELDDETLDEWGDAWESEAIQAAREERDAFFRESAFIDRGEDGDVLGVSRDYPAMSDYHDDRETTVVFWQPNHAPGSDRAEEGERTKSNSHAGVVAQQLAEAEEGDLDD